MWNKILNIHSEIYIAFFLNLFIYICRDFHKIMFDFITHQSSISTVRNA